MRITFLVIELYYLVWCVFSNSVHSVPSYGVLLDQQNLREGITDDNKIVGGSAALLGEFPYQAALNLNGRLCGGTLISTSIVLTAAHCLKGLPTASIGTFKVTVNTTRLTGGIGAVSRGVRKFVMHASFNANTFANDIAVLALSSPIPNVRLAKLPLANTTRTYAGQLAVIIGWGKTSTGGSISTNLLKTNVTVLANTDCNPQYNDKITSNMVCAAGPGKSVCHGDSGGPMLVDGIQIGITSFGIGCANPQFPAVYTRVTRYVTWIETISYMI